MKMKSLLLAIACGTALQTAYAADIKSVDAIAAIAGDNVITQRQLNIAVAQASKRLPASARPNPTELRQQVLVQLINQALIVEAGKRRGITATDTEIDAALAQSAATRKISVDKLYEHYAKDGISRNSLRREIADDIIVQKVQQQAVLQNARVSEEEIDAAMAQAKQRGIDVPQGAPVRQYRAQHILIRAEKPTALVPAEATIRKIEQQARSGRDFAALAREYSQDGSAAQGGDLGWFGDGVMVPEFENAVQRLKVGQISEPVKTQFGWHLIKLTEVRDTGSKEERQRNTLRQHIMQQKADQATTQLLQQLHDGAYVDIRVK